MKRYSYTIHGTKSGSVVTHTTGSLVLLLRAAYRLATDNIDDAYQLNEEKAKIKATIEGIREQILEHQLLIKANEREARRFAKELVDLAKRKPNKEEEEE